MRLLVPLIPFVDWPLWLMVPLLAIVALLMDVEMVVLVQYIYVLGQYVSYCYILKNI